MTLQSIVGSAPATIAERISGPSGTTERGSAPKTLRERTRAHRARRKRNTPISRAGFDMLRLYRTNLEVRLGCIDEASLQTPNQKETYASVTDLLKWETEQSSAESEAAWDEAYRAERMIEMLLSGIQLRQEIAARVDELAFDNPVEAERFRVHFEAIAKSSSESHTTADDTVLRSLLLRIMERLHWHAKKRFLSRPIRRQATKNILWCMLAAFALAVLPYVAVWVDSQTATDLSTYWTLFALYTALVSGLLGAFFSRLITIQHDWAGMTLDEVFLHREFSYSLLRAGVGVCGALVAFFFFKAGLIEGALFPKFDKMSMEKIVSPDGSLAMAFVVPSKDLALVTVWCFLAGFSEKMVPSLLSNTERQLSEATGSGKGGLRG
jgi:hypothetical protein